MSFEEMVYSMNNNEEDSEFAYDMFYLGCLLIMPEQDIISYNDYILKYRNKTENK